MAMRRDDLTGPEILALLQEHLASMVENSPPGGVNALDVDRLRVPRVTFWSAWRAGELVGCGALQELDPTHGEIKSMRTVQAHLRCGVGSAILRHLEGVALERGYLRLSLETGSGDAFTPARALYEQFGFERCGPFAEYEENGFSVFMTKELGARLAEG
ncbi:MAG: GNAT family N-acetyltransferase [Planctomycetes bacterium]|nr:GNAT family N-acetyltransferase [Planctomycetota bacterium]